MATYVQFHTHPLATTISVKFALFQCIVSENRIHHIYYTTTPNVYILLHRVDMRDFAVQPSTLRFTNATRRSCVIVQITDDDLHEGTESFLLRLSEDSGILVSFDPIATEIVILDNDGNEPAGPL